MNKEYRLNLYLSYAHALSDSAHIIFGLTLYFVSDNLNISILTMGFIYNLSSILRGVSGVSAGILSDKSNFLYWIILFGALSTLGCLVLSISNNTNTFTHNTTHIHIYTQHLYIWTHTHRTHYILKYKYTS